MVNISKENSCLSSQSNRLDRCFSDIDRKYDNLKACDKIIEFINNIISGLFHVIIYVLEQKFSETKLASRISLQKKRILT